LAVVLSVSVVLASEGPAYADGPAPRQTDVAWPVTTLVEPALGRLGAPDILSDGVARASLPLPLLGARPSAKAVVSQDEKLVIIIAACVVGALLLFAVVKIGLANSP
jgi:hypothetical protein